MKKQILRFVQSFCVLSCCLSPLQTVFAQIDQWAGWPQFINSASNFQVRDTFRLQTFDDLPGNNWPYTMWGEAGITDISGIDEEDPGSRSGFTMPAHSGISFEHADITAYQNPAIYIRYGGRDLMTGDSLLARPYKATGSREARIFTAKSDQEIVPFIKQSSSNAYGIDLFTDALSGISSCFVFDSIWMAGDIAAYSLFTGKADWQDTLSWSHLPAARNQHALIDGAVSISSPVQCGDIRFSPDAALSMGLPGVLQAQSVTLLDAGVPLRQADRLKIADCFTVHKTFEEKGKWYFISFPFDVYTSDVDASFRQGDEKTAGSGNYFYIQKYNGEKRAAANSAAGNWETLPVQPAGSLLFERYKGYLIALDAAADTQTLTFSAVHGTFSQGFEAEVQFAVSGIAVGNENPDHAGWQLIGNPFPHPLPVSQIEGNNKLDGFIYVYTGAGYEAFPIEAASPYAIPAFSAFFVKGTRTGTFKLSNQKSFTFSQLLPLRAIQSGLMFEPEAELSDTHPETADPESGTATQAEVVATPAVTARLHQGCLIIRDLPDQSAVSLYSLTGVCLFRQHHLSGSVQFPMHYTAGIYLLQVQSEGHRQTLKLTGF